MLGLKFMAVAYLASTAIAQVLQSSMHNWDLGTFIPYSYAPGRPKLTLRTIAANQHTLWLTKDHGDTQSYCPETGEVDCSQWPGGHTVISVTASGLAYMAIGAPGGQQVYLTSKGKLKYSRAGNKYLPEDAIVRPFRFIQTDIPHGFGYFYGPGAWFACFNSDNLDFTIWNNVSADINYSMCERIMILAKDFAPVSWLYE